MLVWKNIASDTRQLTTWDIVGYRCLLRYAQNVLTSWDPAPALAGGLSSRSKVF